MQRLGRGLIQAGLVQQFIEASKRHLIVRLTRIRAQLLFHTCQPAQEIIQSVRVEALRVMTVTEPIRIAGVQNLFELPTYRHAQHGNSEVNRLAHQRVSAASDHCPCGGEVLDENLFRERAQRHVPILPLPPHSVHSEPML